jgi:cytochrome c-type biogenesis protein CcmE
MSPSQKNRLVIVGVILAGVSVATFFVLRALSAQAEFFLTPKQITQSEYTADQRYRIAGLVKKGSVSALPNGVTRRFVITDCEYDVDIEFTGILPDLFREGQTIVATGVLDASGLFTASEVLAKHDENYVPKEAAELMMQAQANKCDDVEGTVDY